MLPENTAVCRPRRRARRGMGRKPRPTCSLFKLHFRNTSQSSKFVQAVPPKSVSFLKLFGGAAGPRFPALSIRGIQIFQCVQLCLECVHFGATCLIETLLNAYIATVSFLFRTLVCWLSLPDTSANRMLYEFTSCSNDHGTPECSADMSPLSGVSWRIHNL